MEFDRILREAYPDVESDDPVAFFSRVGDVFQALCFTWLFWPHTFELYGAAFLALDGNDQRELEARLATPFGDGHPEWPPLPWTAAVDSYNRFEIPHLFRRWRGPEQAIPFAQARLGEVLSQTWRFRLQQAWPDREFSVMLIDADEDNELRIEVRQTFPELVIPNGWDEQRRFIDPDSSQA